MAVASIIAQLHLDHEAVMAALLHDVIEDTPYTEEQLKEEFGASVAEIVDGVSKLDKLKFRTRQEAQVENFRKMILAMTRDIRVVLISLLTARIICARLVRYDQINVAVLRKKRLKSIVRLLIV